MRPRIEEPARRIVDNVLDSGARECDLVTDVAGLMPSYVIAETLGIPHDDSVALYALTETIHAAPESQPPGAAMRAVLEMFNDARAVWEQRGGGAGRRPRHAHHLLGGRRRGARPHRLQPFLPAAR